jgi:hypothetical protein
MPVQTNSTTHQAKTSKPIKLAISCLLLIFIALSLLCPRGAGTAVRFSWKVLPFVLPYVVYFALAVYLHFGRAKLFEILRPEVQMELEKQQMASLTLAGFCFTSLGLLLSFYKEEIKRRDPAPHAILMFFAVALGCFISSHIILRFRGKKFYLLLSDASIDNGLWCILVGLWVFCHRTPGLEGLPIALGAAIAVYSISVCMNVYYHVTTLRD